MLRLSKWSFPITRSTLAREKRERVSGFKSHIWPHHLLKRHAEIKFLHWEFCNRYQRGKETKNRNGREKKKSDNKSSWAKEDTCSRKQSVESPPNWLKEISTIIFSTRHFTSLTCPWKSQINGKPTKVSLKLRKSLHNRKLARTKYNGNKGQPTAWESCYCGVEG